MNPVAVLIPSYRPEPTLPKLVSEIAAALPGSKILIVRDGVFPEQEAIFEELKRMPGVLLLEHAMNLGKGRALKTGFNEILLHHPEIECVVTADADGQHLPADIHNVAMKARSSRKITLGSRFASFSNVPLRSRIGNHVTRLVFRILIGLKLRDTQTGLRGIPRTFIPGLMTISGEKYEYETNVLIGASQRSWAICEESIQTVYIEQNRGSHFNPVMDSMRIYFLLVRFFLSSVATSLIDFVTFLGLSQAGVSLFLSIVFARLVAALFNFNVNRSVVFKSDRKTVVLAIQYWLLVAVMSGFSFVGTRVLSQRGLNLYAAKIVVELTLFIFSFLIQRDIVFRKREAYESD